MSTHLSDHFSPADAVKFKKVVDAVAESVLEMSDENIRQETIEEGKNPEKTAEATRAVLRTASRAQIVPTPSPREVAVTSTPRFSASVRRYLRAGHRPVLAAAFRSRRSLPNLWIAAGSAAALIVLVLSGLLVFSVGLYRVKHPVSDVLLDASTMAGNNSSQTQSESVRVLRTRPLPIPDPPTPTPSRYARTTIIQPPPPPAAEGTTGEQVKPPDEPQPFHQMDTLAQRLRPTQPSDAPELTSGGPQPAVSLPDNPTAPVPSPPPSPAVRVMTPPQPRFEGQIREAQILTQTSPEYPLAVRQAGVQGAVLMSAIVGTDGHVKSVKPLSGPPLLQNPAAAAVKQWVYKPATLNGIPVESETRIELNFTLQP